MATNFKTWLDSATFGDNILTQSDFFNSSQRTSGYASGQPVPAKLMNTILRQNSLITVALMEQFCGSSTVDLTSSLANMKTALAAGIASKAALDNLSTAISNIIGGTTTVSKATNADYATSAGSANTATSATSATNATSATKLAGGSAGSLVYQSAADTTAFLPIGSDGQVLKTDGSTLFWGTVEGGGGSASGGTADDISGGTRGDLLYQYASGDTRKLSIGSNGQILSVDTSATSRMKWINPSSLTVGNATNATNATNAGTANNIAGGSAGDLLYQSASGTTSKLTLGTQDNVLIAGANGPSWAAQSALNVGHATLADSATSATKAFGLNNFSMSFSNGVLSITYN